MKRALLLLAVVFVGLALASELEAPTSVAKKRTKTKRKSPTVLLSNGQKERRINGKPVQGPPRPIPKSPFATVKLPFKVESLEDLARLADSIRQKKGLYVAVPVPTAAPTPTFDPTATLVPTPTPVVLAEATPTTTPEPLVDTGELLDIKVLVIAKADESDPVDISQGGESTMSALPQALNEDTILVSPYAERFEEGVKASNEERWEDAALAFREVRERRPRFLVAWILEIGVLARMGKYEEAGDVAVELDRVFPDARSIPFVERVRAPR
jgi:hypothetical protein